MAARPPARRRRAAGLPGIVYRRDAIDWQHTGTPHQLDLWRITRQAMRSTDLDQMIAVLLGALAPGLPHRQQPRTHPYTLHGRQVDVYHDGRWVEVGECGLAHPRVLAAAGLPGRSGLALGMGLDRLLMLVKHIPDIRLLRSGDPRISRQMHDLARYQQVSVMPPITRDLSIAVGQDDDQETLGDRVRDALGADTSCVEEVRVLSATTCQQLPASAISRLGARPGQKNLLVRVVLRDLETTLTNQTANALRDRIYRALHQGTEYQWAEKLLREREPVIGPGTGGACRNEGSRPGQPASGTAAPSLSPLRAITLRDRYSAWRRAHSRRLSGRRAGCRSRPRPCRSGNSVLMRRRDRNPVRSRMSSGTAQVATMSGGIERFRAGRAAAGARRPGGGPILKTWTGACSAVPARGTLVTRRTSRSCGTG
jgi:hypothetical protein